MVVPYPRYPFWFLHLQEEGLLKNIHPLIALPLSSGAIFCHWLCVVYLLQYDLPRFTSITCSRVCIRLARVDLASYVHVQAVAEYSTTTGEMRRLPGNILDWSAWTVAVGVLNNFGMGKPARPLSGFRPCEIRAGDSQSNSVYEEMTSVTCTCKLSPSVPVTYASSRYHGCLFAVCKTWTFANFWILFFEWRIDRL